MRVLAALSGGVDSAVAAARAKAAGHDVTGIHLAMAHGKSLSGKTRGCCSIADGNDARRVCDLLGVPFYVWDVHEIFERLVIKDFTNSYAQGETPNPCVRCNEFVKFSYVLSRARALGFDALVTGHYARVTQGPAGPQLHRAEDKAKDQSYVLAVMSRDDLTHVMFPLGTSHKSDVRAEAQRLGLPVATKPDSYDICFIPTGNTKSWLKAELGVAPGVVRDVATGEEVGSHQGVHTLTVGQRKGLQVNTSNAPRYVTEIDPTSNTVWVGSSADLDVNEFFVRDVNWLAEPGEEYQIQIRAHHHPVPGQIELRGSGAVCRLGEAQRGVAPGQTVVWYRGTQVVGSGTISKAI
jgi:tRNA-specific 2-thiouridylase